MRIEYHRTLVADKVRNAAFYAALKAVIRPGETVVADIGAGTGLLGLMAIELGAKEVFLYESAAVGGLASDLLEHNRARNCLLLPCHSTEMERPPRVDVVVSETLGNYPVEEDIVAILRDAKKRHLKPGGIMIPRHIQQFVAPVTTSRVHDELTVWDHVGYGIDYSIARTMGLNNIYVRTVTAGDLLDNGRTSVVWDAFDLAATPSSSRKGEATFKIKDAVTIYGFVTWWTAELVAGVSLSTGPESPRTHWEQLYMPLLNPIPCARGDAVGISIRSKTSHDMGTTLAWTATRQDAKGKQISRQTLDLEKGYLP